mgnify:CR=1 FL=1
MTNKKVDPLADKITEEVMKHVIAYSALACEWPIQQEDDYNDLVDEIRKVIKEGIKSRG